MDVGISKSYVELKIMVNVSMLCSDFTVPASPHSTNLC
jgi:hypothetical protein